MLQLLVVSNCAKHRENDRRKLRLNVIISFYIIVFCLETTVRDTPKKYFESTEMGGGTSNR